MISCYGRNGRFEFKSFAVGQVRPGDDIALSIKAAKSGSIAPIQVWGPREEVLTLLKDIVGLIEETTPA